MKLVLMTPYFSIIQLSKTSSKCASSLLQVPMVDAHSFNPQKFQFGVEEVTFLGFLVTKDGIKTTGQFKESILNFPTPQNITDIRSWFGCINQVSYAFASAPIMAPFRHLLSMKVPFQ